MIPKRRRLGGKNLSEFIPGRANYEYTSVDEFSLGVKKFADDYLAEALEVTIGKMEDGDMRISMPHIAHLLRLAVETTAGGGPVHVSMFVEGGFLYIDIFCRNASEESVEDMLESAKVAGFKTQRHDGGMTLTIAYTKKAVFSLRAPRVSPIYKLLAKIFFG